MDISTLGLFFENNSYCALSSRWSYWGDIQASSAREKTAQNNCQWIESLYPSPNNYWSGDLKKQEQYAADLSDYSHTRDELSIETIDIRNKLLNIADNIELFGKSVVDMIAGASANTNTQNLTQTQIDAISTTLLSIEDCARVQSFSTIMDALRQTTSAAQDDVTTFHNKISKLKNLLANNVQPTVEGILQRGIKEQKNQLDNARTAIEEAKKHGTTVNTERYLHDAYEKVRKSLQFIQNNSLNLETTIYVIFLRNHVDLAESIALVQPKLSTFEVIWIETCSFILNSKQNADGIKDVKSLRVFKTRMEKIMKDWSDVKMLLGTQPVLLQ